MIIEQMTYWSFTDKRDEHTSAIEYGIGQVPFTEDNFRDLIEAHNELVAAFNDSRRNLNLSQPAK